MMSSTVPYCSILLQQPGNLVASPDAHHFAACNGVEVHKGFADNRLKRKTPVCLRFALAKFVRNGHAVYSSNDDSRGFWLSRRYPTG